MTKGQQGIPLRSNVVIKPQFIITDFSSDEDVDSDENVDENYDTDNEKGNDNYDGNFFKKQSFDHEGIVPMEVLQENKPNSLIENMTENDAEEEEEKPIEETEDEKNRRNFLDWKQKLEVFDLLGFFLPNAVVLLCFKHENSGISEVLV